MPLGWIFDLKGASFSLLGIGRPFNKGGEGIDKKDLAAKASLAFVSVLLASVATVALLVTFYATALEMDGMAGSFFMIFLVSAIGSKIASRIYKKKGAAADK